MAEAPYLMGIDLGTGGVRVGLFDREGSPVAFRAEEWETRHPHPGWAERDPGEWWTGLVRATRGALEERGLPAAEVAGISVDASDVPISITRETEGSIPTSPRPPPRWSTSSAPSTRTRAATSSPPSSWTATPSCTRR